MLPVTICILYMAAFVGAESMPTRATTTHQQKNAFEREENRMMRLSEMLMKDKLPKSSESTLNTDDPPTVPSTAPLTSTLPTDTTASIPTDMTASIPTDMTTTEQTYTRKGTVMTFSSHPEPVSKVTPATPNVEPISRATLPPSVVTMSTPWPIPSSATATSRPNHDKHELRHITWLLFAILLVVSCILVMMVSKLFLHLRRKYVGSKPSKGYEALTAFHI